jgi:hypothetical protein
MKKDSIFHNQGALADRIPPRPFFNLLNSLKGTLVNWVGSVERRRLAKYFSAIFQFPTSDEGPGFRV